MSHPRTTLYPMNVHKNVFFQNALCHVYSATFTSRLPCIIIRIIYWAKQKCRFPICYNYLKFLLA